MLLSGMPRDNRRDTHHSVPLALQTARRRPGALSSCGREARMAQAPRTWEMLPVPFIPPTAAALFPTLRQHTWQFQCRDLLPVTAAAGQGSVWNPSSQLAPHIPCSLPFSQPKHCQSTCSPDEKANSSISLPLLLLIGAHQIIVKIRKTHKRGEVSSPFPGR